MKKEGMYTDDGFLDIEKGSEDNDIMKEVEEALNTSFGNEVDE